jgi:hypothetical protein
MKRPRICDLKEAVAIEETILFNSLIQAPSPS